MFISTKRSRFYDLLARQAEAVHRGAEALRSVVEHFSATTERKQWSEKVRQVEQEGDGIEREIIDELNRSFITPLDREDIYAIASGMEFILDVIEGVADRIELYSIERLIPEIEAQAAGLCRETGALVQMIADLRNLNKTELMRAIQDLKAAESEMDRHYRSGMASLFHNDKLSALEVFKLKEISEAMEEASDHCEDVADTIERIVIKHA
ncbi:MAG: DUF47 family protein [Clostridia bacterium]|nr:DUF47 family protein [Clostridia bacterium]